MKITYERLNQIIEEEVVKFKNLNEQGPTPADLTVLSKSLKTMTRGDLIKALTEKAEGLTDDQLRDIVGRMK